MLRVLATAPPFQQVIEHYRQRFTAHDIEVVAPRVVQQLSEDTLMEIIGSFDAIIAGDEPLTTAVLEKGRKLKIIAKWGIGLDAVDLPTAKRLGIPVVNTPDILSHEVADVVMAYIVLLARELHKLDQGVRAGHWPKIQGVSLRNKTLGVVGIGSIGQEVVRRGAVAGMRLLGFDPEGAPKRFIRDTGLKLVELDELLSEADFLSLNCSLTSTNVHMIDANTLSLMKTGGYIVNTARGRLIDEVALIDALQSGKVAGAALDVFENEPLRGDSPLTSFENCILGSHNASNTRDAVLRVSETVVNKVIETLAGVEP